MLMNTKMKIALHTTHVPLQKVTKYITKPLLRKTIMIVNNELKTKFKIKEIVYDSNEFQFWGSQQYLEDIPLMAENSYGKNPAKSIFTKTQIEDYKKMADKLNRESQGDQAAIYMVKN